MNIHLTIDDKFIDSFIENTKKYSSTDNLFIVFSNSKELKYVKKKDDVNVISSKEEFFEIANQYKEIRSVCIHWLSTFAVEIINELPKNINVIMFFWGGEIFEMSIFQEDFLYQQITKDYLFPTRQHFYEKFNNVLEQNKLKALSRINYFAHYLYSDYKLIKSRLKMDAQFLYFAYPLDIQKQLHNEEKLIKTNTVILGNSADPANNHIDALYNIKKINNEEEIRIICPLSYAGSENYKNQVTKVGNELFGERFIPLLDFIQPKEYNELLNNSTTGIFNNIRSQAAWNIFRLLHLGKRIYLNSRSNLYDFIQSKGGVVNSIDEGTLNFSPLNSYEKKLNKYFVEQHYSGIKNELIFTTILDSNLVLTTKNYNNILLGNHTTKNQEMKNHSVSVVIPTYNRENLIEKAVKSVENQTYKIKEIIIVDDCSNDATKNIINKLIEQNSRIKYIKFTEQKGAQAARNAGIIAAESDWVAFLDSDDEWIEDYIHIALNTADSNNVGIVYSNYIKREINNNDITETIINPEIHYGNVEKEILEKSFVSFPGLLVKKEYLENIGYLDESIKSWQEWETMIRLAQNYPIAYNSKPAFYWNWHNGETISKNDFNYALGVIQIIIKHQHLFEKNNMQESMLNHLINAKNKIENLDNHEAVFLKEKINEVLIKLSSLI